MSGTRTEAGLEERIALLEARAQISELRARFCIYADERRWEDLVELFTEDGVLDIRGPVEGREAILTAVSALPTVWDTWWHFVNTEVTDISGDTAEGVSYFDAPYAAGGESYNALGRYDDTFALVDGEWKFSRRVLSFAVSAPWSQGMTTELPDGLRPANG